MVPSFSLGWLAGWYYTFRLRGSSPSVAERRRLRSGSEMRRAVRAFLSDWIGTRFLVLWRPRPRMAELWY